ncbi:MFS transporter [Thermotoga profunda]|uniref:MFS transporter n=1 Tax=Thermotoga profunda TaxID=1508420 RepID=UPI000596E62E|nr:MFS transporter [Thermotoga profunda]
MRWRELDKNVRIYLLFISISGFSFSSIIAVPTLGKLMNISMENVGWLFSVSYIVQAILAYVLGRRFEKISVNYGLFLARTSFAVGSLIFAFSTGLWSFAIAQMFLSLTDIFYPCQVMYERAIFTPKYREVIYSFEFFMTEFLKTVSYFVFVFLLAPFMNGQSFLRAVFFMVFCVNVFYAFSYLKILPKIDNGMQVPDGHVIATTNLRTFLSIMFHQYLCNMAFNFASFLVISYYLIDYFKLGGSSPFLFELVFSASVASSIFWKRFVKNHPSVNLTIGILLITLSFVLWLVPNVYLFFISHVIMGVGFILWFPARETIKLHIAPRELGRWEGFFQGLNIFSRIFIPVISAYVATRMGYHWVFVVSAVLATCSLLVSLPALVWMKRNYSAIKV